MSPAKNPTSLNTTGYVVLALLAVQPSTAYELKMQVERGPLWFWPRSGNKLYDTPKQLVAAGLATANPGTTGRRPRTVYQITTAGRRALHEWLRLPSEPPRIQAETLVRTLFADHGDKAALQETLQSFSDMVNRMQTVGAERGEEYRHDGGPFPERLHVNVLIFEFLWRYTEALREWADWALEEVDTWDGIGTQLDRRQLHLSRYGEVADIIRARNNRSGTSHTI